MEGRTEAKVLAWSKALLEAVGTWRKEKIPSGAEWKRSRRGTKPVLPHLAELLGPLISYHPHEKANILFTFLCPQLQVPAIQLIRK